jgi:hypothetical protein
MGIGIASAGRCAAGDELDRHLVSHHARDAGLHDASEPISHPPMSLRRGLDLQVSMGQFANPQGLEPDAICLLADGARKLSLHA